MNYGLIKTKRGVLRSIQTPLTLMILIWTLGCINKPPCKENFTKTITPIKVQNKNEVVFSIDDFDFLLDSTYVIEDVRLEGDLVQHKSRKEDFTFSINGVKTSRKDNDDIVQIDCGKKNPVDKDKTKDHFEKHRFCANPHMFYLNGGESILDFMVKIKKNKGVLTIKLQGRDHEISNVKLIVTGKHYMKCSPPPTPSPTPTPPAAVAPKTTINSVNPKLSPTAMTVKTIEFSADQAGVTFFCSLDGAAATGCTSPQNYASLGNGSHLFKVYAKNSAGLVDAVSASHTWVVDAVAPTITIDNLSVLKSSTNSDAISFEFSSDDPDSTYTCLIDNNPSSACSSPKSYSGLSEGTHKFSVISTDAVGNVSPVPAVFNWTIDKTVPETTIISAVPAGAVNNASSLSLEFSANESAAFACAIDDSIFRTCVSPQTFTGLVEGAHTILVRATDLVGNQGLPASYSWRTDTTAPVITLGNILPNQGLTSGHEISVEFSLSEMGSAMCAYDGGAAATCSSPFTRSENVDGAHSLVISAKDLAGNVAASVSVSWDMDFLLPIVSFGTILPNATSYIKSQDFSAVILPSKPMHITARLNGQDLGPVSSPIELLALPEGSYKLEVSGYDAVGNTANTIAHEFTVDMTAPTVVLASQYSGATKFDSNVLTFSSNDGSPLQCNVDGAGFGACVSPLNLAGLAEGNHAAQVRAVDLAGNVGSAESVQWSVDTVAPLTTLLMTQLGRDSFSFSLMSSEPNSQFSCSLDSAPATPCSNVVAFNALAPGLHTFVAWAMDGAGNTDPVGASASMNVRPPVTTLLSKIVPQEALSQSRSIEFTFASNHADAHFLCSLNGSPAAACASPLTYSGLADGNYSFVVRAVDIFGNVDPVGANYSWIIDGTAPVTSLTGTKLSANSFRADFSASETGSTFICTLDGSSPAACTSPATYSGLAVGSHIFRVWAQDTAGNKDPVGGSYTVVVNPPITTTITSANPSAAFTKITNVAFTFVSNDSNATFQCSIDNSPMSACSTPKSYPELANGSHTFRVQAIDAFGNADPVSASYSWTVDTIAPTMPTVSISVTSTSITVTWTTSEPTTTKLFWGKDTALDKVVPEDAVYTTNHSVRLTGLAANSVYSLQPAGTDRAGNAFLASRFTARTSR